MSSLILARGAERNLKRYALAIWGVALAVIGVYQVKNDIITQVVTTLPSVREAELQTAFLIALVTAIVAIILAIPVFVSHYIINEIKLDLSFLGEEAFAGHCQRDDLEEIHELARHEFGGRCSSLQNIQRLHSYCPATFWVVKDRGVLAYFVIYSLRPAGERAILGGYYNGANPADEHINRTLRHGRSICIGAVVGRGRRGRAAALAALSATVENLPHERIYVKPISRDGLRLAKKRRFTTLEGHFPPTLEKYCVLDRSTRKSVPIVHAIPVAS